MKPTYLLMFALVGGCIGKNDLDVDSRFTAEEQADILQAAGDWTIATKEEINLTFGVHVDGDLTLPKHEIIRATSRTYMRYTIDDSHATDVGFTTQTPIGSHIVLIVDRIGAQHGAYHETFRDTIRHEFGHWLGASHTRIPGSIMFARNVGIFPNCIDSASVDNYCMHKDDCDRSQLVGCAIPNQDVWDPTIHTR
jgi:hypothetical protein